MNNEKRDIALIYGGVGAEHKVSLMSKDYLRELIDQEKYRLTEVLIDTDGTWRADGNPTLLCPGGFLKKNGERIAIDAAFPVLHGDFGEDGTVAGALEVAGIPYVGCRVGAGAVCSDKALTKMIAERLGIQTVRWILRIGDGTDEIDTLDAEEDCSKRIGYPMFIKPSGLGSSVGCAAVMTPAAFPSAYAEAARLGKGRVLIEEFLGDRRELECAVMSVSGLRVLSHPGEVICHGPYTYDEKYSKSTHSKVCVRADVSKAVSDLIKRYSQMLCDAIGIRHLARIDFFLSQGQIYLNEINTMPGFTAASLYPKLIEAEGICPKDLVSRLIEDSLQA